MDPHWHFADDWDHHWDHDWDYEMIRRNPSMQGPALTEWQAILLVFLLLLMIVSRCCALIRGHEDIEGHEDRHEHDE